MSGNDPKYAEVKRRSRAFWHFAVPYLEEQEVQDTANGLSRDMRNYNFEVLVDKLGGKFARLYPPGDPLPPQLLGYESAEAEAAAEQERAERLAQARKQG